jgi:hypothetical protein
MRVESMPPSGVNYCLQIEARVNDANSVLQVYGTGNDVQFPPLLVWKPPGLQLLESAAGAVAQLGALPAEPSPDLVDPSAPSERLDYFDWVARQGEDIAWHQRTAGESLVLDDVLREDFDLSVAIEWLTQHNTSVGAAFLQKVTTILGCARSPRLPLARLARVPVSRGAKCELSGKALEPCPLTDGKLELVGLTSWLGANSSEQPQPDWVLIDLGQAVSVRTIVIRDLHRGQAPLQVEGSVDRVNWTVLTTVPFESTAGPMSGFEMLAGDGLYTRLDLPAGTPAVTQVRLGTGMPWGLQFAREISLFE